MFITLLTERTVASKFCQDELALAYISNKPIFPVSIQPQSEIFPKIPTGMWVLQHCFITNAAHHLFLGFTKSVKFIVYCVNIYSIICIFYPCINMMYPPQIQTSQSIIKMNCVMIWEYQSILGICHHQSRVGFLFSNRSSYSVFMGACAYTNVQVCQYHNTLECRI